MNQRHSENRAGAVTRIDIVSRHDFLTLVKTIRAAIVCLGLLRGPACGSVPAVSKADDSDEPRNRLSRALADVARGDRAALETAYRLASAKLFGICLRILNDRGEAEDALQEVYVSVWRRAGSFDATRASPVTWLATLARNRSIDRLRALKRRGGGVALEAADAIADPSPDALSLIEAGQDSQRLTHCLGELEPRTAEAIRAAFFGGLTYSDLAARGKVPLGTVKSWIRRGLARLKGCLEQ
jgi:RNA polymerase sigma-70 factor (ECF subfamily)